MKFNNSKPSTVGIVAVAVIVAVVIVCCGFGVLSALFGGDQPTGKVSTDTAEATTPSGPRTSVELIGCEVDDTNTSFPTAEVIYEFTNKGDISGSYWLDVKVLSSSGATVGSTRDWVIDVEGGETVASEVKLYLDTTGGIECTVTLDE